MNLPGFAATASLYRSRRAYSGDWARRGPSAAGVVPAWCTTTCKGGECYSRCCDCYMGECNCWTSMPRPI